jgi:SAM-dependent methyltransferase
MEHQQPNAARTYYGERFWNEIPAVAEYVNVQISGDPNRGWAEHFFARRGRPAEHALVLNCGNGAIERQLFDSGYILSATGIDISAQLLDEATTAAADRPLRYDRMDVNTAEFPAEPFDLVVNFSAAHHIACLDRVFRELCRRLPDDGWFLSYDYVGPHRNQYPYQLWAAAWDHNQQLPEAMRQTMIYPHLPTMLAVDPTEAIHSELLFETWSRYFTTDEHTPVGGTIAYPLLTHNDDVIADPQPWADEIAAMLAADEELRRANPKASLFAYWAGQPDKSMLTHTDRLARWTEEEDDRERTAASAAGEYYPRTALQAMTDSLSDRGVEAEHARAWALELLEQLQQLSGTMGDLEALRLDRDALQQRLDDVLSSRSWRATEPLRRVRDFVRRPAN